MGRVLPIVDLVADLVKRVRSRIGRSSRASGRDVT